MKPHNESPSEGLLAHSEEGLPSPLLAGAIGASGSEPAPRRDAIVGGDPRIVKLQCPWLARGVETERPRWLDKDKGVAVCEGENFFTVTLESPVEAAEDLVVLRVSVDNFRKTKATPALSRVPELIHFADPTTVLALVAEKRAEAILKGWVDELVTAARTFVGADWKQTLATTTRARRLTLQLDEDAKRDGEIATVEWAALSSEGKSTRALEEIVIREGLDLAAIREAGEVLAARVKGSTAPRLEDVAA
jgi:hypothetical protein